MSMLIILYFILALVAAALVAVTDGTRFEEFTAAVLLPILALPALLFVVVMSFPNLIGG